MTEADRIRNAYMMQRLLLDEEACLAPAPELGIREALAVHMTCQVPGKDDGIRAFGSLDGHITAVMKKELNPAAMSIDQMTLESALFWIRVQTPDMEKPLWSWVTMENGELSCLPPDFLEVVRRFFLSRGIIAK